MNFKLKCTSERIWNLAYRNIIKKLIQYGCKIEYEDDNWNYSNVLYMPVIELNSIQDLTDIINDFQEITIKNNQTIIIKTNQVIYEKIYKNRNKMNLNQVHYILADNQLTANKKEIENE